MKGKTVLVTGANGGLGVNVTRAFLDAGATVIGTSRKITQAEFPSQNFVVIPADITTPEGANSLIAKTIAQFPGHRHSDPLGSRRTFN